MRKQSGGIPELKYFFIVQSPKGQFSLVMRSSSSKEQNGQIISLLLFFMPSKVLNIQNT